MVLGKSALSPETEPEGADHWSPSVDHTPHGWAVSSSLKRDLGSHLHAYHSPLLVHFGSSAPYTFGEQPLKYSGGPLFLRGNLKGVSVKNYISLLLQLFLGMPLRVIFSLLCFPFQNAIRICYHLCWPQSLALQQFLILKVTEPWSLRPSQVKAPVFVNLQSFPHCKLPKNGCMPLWGRTKESIAMYICHGVAGSFLLDTWTSLQSVGPVSKNLLKRETWGRAHDILLG